MIDLTTKNQAPKKKTAVALGLFDGLHKGHRAVLQGAIDCSKQGLSPAVFTFDTTNCLPSKDAMSIMPFELKLEMLEEMGIEYIFTPNFDSLHELSPKAFVEEILIGRLNAGAAVCGEDFHFGKNAKGDSRELARLCAEHDINVIICPAVRQGDKTVSSTAIREYIKQGNIAAANEMLGFEFTLRLKVIHGTRLGRTIGFPTINQQAHENQLLPKFGVYASTSIIDGKEYPSITNIGIKPTAGDNFAPIIETHILDFNKDLYGQRITVRLRDFIRDERKFSGLEELKAQILSDTEQANKER